MLGFKKKTTVDKNNTSLKDTKILWGIIFILAALVFVGVFTLMNSITKQDTYYVLSHSVAARTKITTADVTSQPAQAGTVPKNALNLSDIQQGNVYSKWPLNQGDLLQASNAGSLDSLNEGIPDNWVVTSFKISDADVIPSSLQRGDYFDLMLVSSDSKSADIKNLTQGSRYLFRNVMVLDTTNAVSGTSDSSSSSNGQSASTTDSSSSNGVDFVVGMSPKNAAVLQAAMTSGANVVLVTSPKQNTYQNPSDLDKLYDFGYDDVTNALNGIGNSAGIIASDCTNSTTGESTSKDCTDNTFTPQSRDQFGVPYNATSSEIDSNGDVKSLTKFEKQWCEQLGDSYYSSSKWDEEKAYCKKHGVTVSSSSSDSTSNTDASAQ
jgi:hypothetical protein